MRSLLPVIRRLTPVSRVERVLDQLTAMLAHETDYRNERQNIEKMRVMRSPAKRTWWCRT